MCIVLSIAIAFFKAPSISICGQERGDVARRRAVLRRAQRRGGGLGDILPRREPANEPEPAGCCRVLTALPCVSENPETIPYLFLTVKRLAGLLCLLSACLKQRLALRL